MLWHDAGSYNGLPLSNKFLGLPIPATAFARRNGIQALNRGSAAEIDFGTPRRAHLRPNASMALPQRERATIIA